MLSRRMLTHNIARDFVGMAFREEMLKLPNILVNSERACNSSKKQPRGIAVLIIHMGIFRTEVALTMPNL